MVDFLSVSFWMNFAFFILVVFFAFYIPSVFFVRKLKITRFQEIVLSFLVGMVLWGWQGYIFGYLGVRWASYLYLLIFFIFWVKNYFKNKNILNKPNFFLNKKTDFILITILLLGILSQLTAVWFTGVSMPKGLYFCCGSVQDNILQIAITDQIIKHFPPMEPGMYGTYVQNYHYWDSLVMGELIRVFHLPLIATDYQFMTVFISLFLGLSAVVFAELLKLGKAFTRWLLFFLYFGGDFVWLIVTILRKRDFFSMYPLESGQQFLENLPRATAVIVFFCALSLLILWIKKKDLYLGILLAIVISTLVGFKIYIGIFVLSGLGILGLYYLLKRKYFYLFPIALSFLLSFIIYIPVNSHSGGLYFTGLWRFENFIVQPYLGDLIRLEFARIIYLQHHSWLRVIEYELIFAFVFIFSTFGTKLLGLFQSKKSLSLLPKELNIVLFSGISVSAVIGLFFGQSTGGSNTFNFLVSIFIIGSIYTALACYYWLDKRNRVFKIILILLIVVLTLTRGVNQIYRSISELSRNEGFIITNNELAAIDFLSLQTDSSSLVLVDPKIKMNTLAPYIGFLSNKKMFLAGQKESLITHGVNFEDRQIASQDIFYGLNSASASVLLLKHKIGYIYLLKEDNLASTNSAIFVKTVFINKEFKIQKVDVDLARNYLRNYKGEF